jgi:hypothetical protein
LAVSSFTAPLILEALASEQDGRGEFRVYQPFSYDVGHLGSGETVTVPTGFRTDLCSVPAIARPFVPLAGRLAKPALLHDWLLSRGEVDRAHRVFDEALAVAGVRHPWRGILVFAVRAWSLRRRLAKGY